MKAHTYIMLGVLLHLTLTNCAARIIADRPTRIMDKKTIEGFQRGMWIRAAAAASPESISRIVQVAGEANITDVYLQVVVGGYAYHRSRLLPRSQYVSKISGADYDPLDSLIKALSHTQVRVHAWVNTLLYWSLPDPPDSMTHVFYTHPDWFIEDVNQQSMRVYSYQQWKGLRVEGLYLDPAVPQVCDFIRNICREIATHYHVDGIHLDFIRYPGILWGLPRTDQSAMFASADAEEIRYCNTISYSRSELYKRWKIWHAWRLTRSRKWTIESLVNDVSEAVREAAPARRIQLSCAVFANPSLIRYSFAQDWTEWADDRCLPIIMSYTPDITLFNDYLEFAVRARPEAIMGIGLLWTGMDTLARVQENTAREAGTGGVCYFDFTSIDTIEGFLPTLKRTDAPTDRALDSNRCERVHDAFTFRPQPEHIRQGTHFTDWGSDIDFAAFLLSLSLSPHRDLTRMGLTRTEFIDLVSQDVAAFSYLDRKIFPLSNDLIEPPQRSVRFAFLPWSSDDSVTVVEKAATLTEFTHQTRLYPVSTDPITSAVFAAQQGCREILTTPAGVYVFLVDTLFAEGGLVSRTELSPQTLPVYAGWTIRKKFTSILDNGN